jgi:hypothetical protein
MAHAEILIEDEGENVAFRIKYTGGAKTDSRAHQLANMIRVYAESILEQVGEPEELTDSPLVVPAHGQVQETSHTSPGQTLVD